MANEELNYGEVAERLKALVLKTSVARATVGSNPTLSAMFRGVAQPGSASGLGPEGRGFESLHPDHKEAKE